MLTDEELLNLNHSGFIPGPLETESNFMERVSYCLSLSNTMDNTIFEPLPEVVKACLLNRYGFCLNWTPILYSNKDLALWHGGCAWIFQKDATTPKGAFFQLRRTYESKNSFLGYSKEEIITHESSHVARMDFEEPIYEEFLAYHLSENSFRRYFGPIITQSYEVIVFLIALFTPFLFPSLIFLPILLILFALYRLYQRQTTLQKVREKIGDQILFRLTDREIQTYSNKSTDEIKGIIYSQRENSLRQRLLHLLLKNPSGM